jgi:hypothetical protein
MKREKSTAGAALMRTSLRAPTRAPGKTETPVPIGLPAAASRSVVHVNSSIAEETTWPLS